ncbi:hypothetical protein [Streptomyces hawaiiensis]|uniref:UL36 very large tegument protein n=1 Tax=Streptomyces hawaiiensis TaxID=67305 RepID=A0A6G5RN23_9ACTN|nr:hypothetical protein [Streptomyces hawaiiensis]QCD59244.1 hypothetical protein CEB94_33925 [Streptomyces hawaiiensis]
MAADQLPAEVGEFATYLDGLLARLDPSGGWYAVFWQRDPEGMRACLDGREMPPWDVVEALLQDLAGQYGPGGAAPETDRARALHAAALAAYDTRPGGRDALGDRLDVMLREQKYAAERQAALARHLTSATTREQADALRLELAWARDDHERAGARCAELRARMAHVDRCAQEVPPRAWDDGDGLGGTGSEPSTAEDPYKPGTPRAATGAAVAPGAGWHAPRHPAGRVAPGEAAGGGTSGPRGYDGTGAADRHDTGDGAVGWLVPQYPAGRAAPEEAAAGGTPGTLSAPAMTGAAGRYDAWDGAGAPGAGSRAPQYPAGRAAPGEVAAGGTSDVLPAWASAPAAPDAFTAPEPPAPKQRKRRRGSARFAGMVDEEAVPVAVPPAAVPDLPASAPASTRRTPRGARFAGAAEEAVVQRPAREAGVAGAADRADVGRTVETLARLRSEGRSGEAHALLAEAASWEPGRFPLLAERLHLAGLDADWQTLLWEAASLPAGRLVAAADALVAAGRAGDGQQMLRQGVARPPGEVGEAVLALAAEGLHREVRVLLDAYVRARAPEEAARSAEPDPRRLVPLLLEAARGVSDERRWDLVHALRVAGHPA